LALKPSDSVKLLRGVGERRCVQLSFMGIESIGDLLRHAPLRYEDRRTPTAISALEEGRPAVVCGVIR
jgi:RecG-like helicase